MTDFWLYERGMRDRGYEVICGVDEAGRGPLAGPVFAAAVVLPFGIDIPGLNDSKKVSGPMRERLYDEIAGKAVAYGVALATHEEIDSINILQATYLAMNRAVDGLITAMREQAKGPGRPVATAAAVDIALIDGNRNCGIAHKSICITGGDGKSASIAAASILAKVSRDRFMLEMAERYPQYGFERHKGYGTRLHYEKLREFGPSEIHRASFLRRL